MRRRPGGPSRGRMRETESLNKDPWAPDAWAGVCVEGAQHGMGLNLSKNNEREEPLPGNQIEQRVQAAPGPEPSESSGTSATSWEHPQSRSGKPAQFTSLFSLPGL